MDDGVKNSLIVGRLFCDGEEFWEVPALCFLGLEASFTNGNTG